MVIKVQDKRNIKKITLHTRLRFIHLYINKLISWTQNTEKTLASSLHRKPDTTQTGESATLIDKDFLVTTLIKSCVYQFNQQMMVGTPFYVNMQQYVAYKTTYCN